MLQKMITTYDLKKLLTNKGEAISEDMASTYIKQLLKPLKRNANETEEIFNVDSMTVMSFLTNLLGVPINNKNEVTYYSQESSGEIDVDSNL